ncbi:MAG TPA: ATP synthase subunit I [Candidatus Binataceae bacterium]|nr:ATP synthase subunit I [Candidatus Binataceae bacterium]
MPTIRSIQITNVLLVCIAAAAMACFVSTAAAIGCLLGGAFVVANLFLLGLLGRFALSAARASGGVSRTRLAAMPLKIALMVGLIYLVFARIHIDGLGFALGVLTQMTAIIIETGRTALRKNRTGAGIPEEL